LGLLYWGGDGVAQDFVLAHMYLNLARAQGNESAGIMVEGMISLELMTKEQVAEAQKMASEWLEKHQ